MKHHTRSAAFALLSALAFLATSTGASADAAARVDAGTGEIQCEIYYLHAGGMCDADRMPSSYIFVSVDGPSRLTLTFDWTPVSTDAQQLHGHFQTCSGEDACVTAIVGESPITLTAETNAEGTHLVNFWLSGTRHCAFTEFPSAPTCGGLPRIILDQEYTYKLTVEPIS